MHVPIQLESLQHLVSKSVSDLKWRQILYLLSFCLEIKEFELNMDDKFMILASDGVWEFLSSDEVVDIVVPYWHRNDLKGACN